MNPELTRRRLLAALACSPLLAKYVLAAEPPADANRVIAIEWLPLELLLALGVMPIGAAELHGYQDWVGEPKLPPSVVDVGLRVEPNLELITQMKPSLIIYSEGYGPAPTGFQRIAPWMGFSFNDGKGKPLTNARRSLMTLAQRIGREPQAQAHLSELAALLAAAKGRLHARPRRPLLLMSILDTRHAIVFTANGLFQEVLDELGLQNAWQGESSFWGSAVIGIERLAAFRDVDVICYGHGNASIEQQVFATPLWQSFAFVREGRFKTLPRVWFYGATLSAMQLVHSLEHALEAA